ncbi:MAG TPA: hypothetical protein VEJ86_14465 [Candidatus Binataceae bacterium]|nr:hypothetical protein [Candidatus Binataceae bacterium]
MKPKHVVITLAAIVCWALTLAPASAQSQKQLDLEAAKAQRKAIVGQGMNLTADEGGKFWPLYDEYEGKMDKIELRHLHELQSFAKHYNTLTDDDAAKKLDEVMAIQEARLDTQKAYIPKFRAILSSIKVTRFFQIDNKLRAMVQCDIANAVPLAASPEEQSQQ